MSETSRFDRIATLTLVACALFVAATSAIRTFSKPVGPPPRVPPIALAPEVWQRVRVEGESLGASDGKAQIVLFSDFECPFCRNWALTILPALRKKYSSRLAISFRHWPLAQHRFAPGAARASLCANDQGRFEAYHDRVFAQQDSIGLIPFTEFARRAQVPDLGRFESCATSRAPLARLSADSALVAELGGQGTPMVIVNGVLFRQAPTVGQVDSLVSAALARHPGAR